MIHEIYEGIHFEKVIMDKYEGFLFLNRKYLAN